MFILEPYFDTTKSGNPVLVWQGYRYNRRLKDKGSKARWTCNKNPAGCRACIITFDEVVITQTNSHNH